MACPFCRFLAWVQHKLDVRAENKAARAEEQAARAEEQAARGRDEAREDARTKRIVRARSASRQRRCTEPPPFPLPSPGSTENLAALRARIPPRSHILDDEEDFLPPEPSDTMIEACRDAAESVCYTIAVAIAEPERELVAARAVQAIARAVSTTPSYPVFVATVTMAESIALICSENPVGSRYYTLDHPGIAARRRQNAFDAAVEAGMTAHAENNTWPGDNNIDGCGSQDNSEIEFDSDSQTITNRPDPMQSSEDHTRPRPLRRRLISCPSAP
ncbi:hypothetical protein Daus18300_007403 [Diaporthe australafricana]|uniref:Uncharacterized protein n=1 Tax=Diaporthe australafricana TaxID=127596 RepID=A0ABR3WN06_9PEZI